MLSVFVENLGKYNEGELVGRWLELPCSDDELQSALKEIGIGSPRFDGGVYEEWFVADWDCDIPFLKYSEYPNLDEWSEVAEWFDGASERDKALVSFLLDDDMSRTFDEAVGICRSGEAYFVGGIESAYDVGRYFAEEYGLLDDVGEEVARYFGFESYGQSFIDSGIAVIVDGGTVISYL